MKIGVSSYTYAWNIQRGMTASDLLDEAIRLNADVVQMFDNLNPQSLDWSELGPKAKDHGIELHVGNLGGPEEVLACAKIAAQIGSPIVRLVIGPAFATQSPSEIADDLRDAARFCQDNGARLVLENHDFFLTAQQAEIIPLIGHGCAAILDTANSLSNLEGTESILRNLGPMAICLHAKDVVAEREFHMFGFRVFGVAAGKGSVDFHMLKANLPNLEWVILEQWMPAVNNQPPLAVEKETAGPSLDYLRGVWK